MSTSPTRVGEISHTTPDISDAIDLVHLARQTLGDRVLEIELLGLFERQALQILSRLTLAGRSASQSTRAGLAHTLRGSALAVGAIRVASAAQAFETAGDAMEADTQIEALRKAVDEARRVVAHLLAA